MIEYVKYGTERGRTTAVVTTIESIPEGKIVRKRPQYPEAAGHVAAMEKIGQLLETAFNGTRFVPNRVRLLEDGSAAFEFLKAPSLEETLEAAFAESEEKGISLLLDLLAEVDGLANTEFTWTESFEKRMGKWEGLEGLPAVVPADIDLLPENIFVTGNKWTVIDYEWTFPCPVPVSFLKWRILHYFGVRTGRESLLAEAGLFEAADINLERKSRYYEMEIEFQRRLEAGHIPFRNLYASISPGVIRIDKSTGELLYGDGKKTVTVYLDQGEGFTEKNVLRENADAEGCVSMRFALIRTRSFRVDPTEMPCLVSEICIEADGARLPLGEAVTDGRLLAADRILFPEEDPKITFNNIDAAEIRISMKIAPLSTAEAARLERETAEVLKLKEEIAGLRGRYAHAERKYRELRALALKRADILARTEGNRSVGVYRALLKGSGKPDPLAILRRPLEKDETDMKAKVDQVLYQGGHVVIRGWAFDGHHEVPNIVALEGKRALPMRLRWKLREDVNGPYSLDHDLKAGFLLKIPDKEIKKPKITLAFDSPEGYITQTVRVLLDPKVREAYMREHGMPTFAVDDEGYDDWFRDRQITKEEFLHQTANQPAYSPLISVVIPLYNTKEEYLIELMDSLLGQSYRNLEVCLADGSTEIGPGRLIRNRYLVDKRVSYQKLAENEGISGNTNAAIRMSRGEFILLADHDDLLEPNAIYEVVRALNENPTADVIYTDEDKQMPERDEYYSPNFKPDFNIDLLCSNNYITHIFCVRRSVAVAASPDGRFERSEFDGAQDHDFIFRCCEKARKIVHVPKFLYHWRAYEDSTAGNPESKMYAYERGKRAVQEHYDRLGIPARVELASDIGCFRSVYTVQGEPRVSIIIPNKDHKEVLERCLCSIFEKSTYSNYEIIIAENNSREAQTFAYYEQLKAEHENVRVVTWNYDFNFSAINNFAAKSANGDYLLFLNNDTEVITDRWLEELLGYCQRRDVGVCGAKLFYPNDTLQHCGVVVGIGGIAGHICAGEKRESGGYYGRIAKSQDVSAVTGACLMIPADLFRTVGGFEESLAVAYNDVDLCLKVRKMGLLVVYDAFCELYHYESVSRGLDEIDEKKRERQLAEARILRDRWPEIFREGDPYFNPNLEYNAADYVLAGTMPDGYTPLQELSKKMKAGDKRR